PLALELAASRALVLTPSQMVAQLEHRFEFLATKHRDVPERHRTLRATLDWSYQRLEPGLQQLFARLAVFRGGWTLEAGEAVAAPELASAAPLSLVDALMQLRASSLILADEPTGGSSPDAGMRYRLLETLREYAAEQLSAEEAGMLQRSHAA